MGGDDSQKLLPWSGAQLLSGAQTSGSVRNHTVTETVVDLPDAVVDGQYAVAQRKAGWVIFAKQRWGTPGARRSTSPE